MQSTTYKLAEYKITENEHGDLLWETHIGLGSLRIGKCFINGDILFIRPNDSKGPGFLKGEFLDHPNKMPKWGKTKYCCASYKIYNCKSVYFVAENLVLWARSETIGYAVNPAASGSGMMEYLRSAKEDWNVADPPKEDWNAEDPRLVEWDLFL